MGSKAGAAPLQEHHSNWHFAGCPTSNAQRSLQTECTCPHWGRGLESLYPNPSVEHVASPVWLVQALWLPGRALKWSSMRHLQVGGKGCCRQGVPQGTRFFFVEDRPKEPPTPNRHQLPTANRCQPPAATNRHGGAVSSVRVRDSPPPPPPAPPPPLPALRAHLVTKGQ